MLVELSQLAKHPRVVRACLWRPETLVRAVRCDSRRCGPQVGFLALKGLREDGHAFIGQAVAAGAPAVFLADPARFAALEANPPEGLGGVLLVDDPRRALAELAGDLAGHPSRELALLGVTGTNGKTTTTHLVAQMLEGRGQSCALIGTLGMRLGERTQGSERTTPEAPELQDFLRECVSAGARHAAMEVSSIGVALMRSHGLRFHAVAFTNLTQDHLDFHGDLEAYKAAKFRLFLEQPLGRAVVNLDDPAGAELAVRLGRERPEVSLITVSCQGAADLRIREAATVAGGQTGVLHHAGQSAPFHLPLLGRFNLSNYLCAVGLLLGEEFTLEALAEAGRHCVGALGRFERVPISAPFSVVVDYAHSPDALENVLRTARLLTRGRLVVVFGAGGDRDRDKRPLMGQVAQRLADRVVLTSDNPRSEDPDAILAQIAAGMNGGGAAGEVLRISDRREAIVRALETAEAGDVVLIAGKGDERYQEIKGVKRPFEDRKIVLEWWSHRT